MSEPTVRCGCEDLGPMLLEPGQSWECRTCGRLWTRDAGQPVTPHPAALVLDDHQPVYVTAATQPGQTIRCGCGDWAGPWCDFAGHQAAVLAAGGLLRHLMCGRCGTVALPEGSTPTVIPQGWEWFMVRGERRYACPTCVQDAVGPA